MSNQILQQFKGQSIRIITVDDTARFVLKDLCAALELSNPRTVAKRLDADEVSLAYVTDAMGREQETHVVNESGLYAVILRSDKPQAREFRKWVTNEVLPSIRQTGGYSTAPALPAAFDFSALQKLADLTPIAIENKVAEAKAEIRQEIVTVRTEVTAEIDEKVGALNITSEQRWEVRSLVGQIVGRRRELNLGRSHWGHVYGELYNACRIGSLDSMNRDQFPKAKAYLEAELTALGAMSKSGLFNEAQAASA